MYGIENDLNITNAGSKVLALVPSVHGPRSLGKVSPGLENVIGFSVGAPISGTNKWTSGLIAIRLLLTTVQVTETAWI